MRRALPVALACAALAPAAADAAAPGRPARPAASGEVQEIAVAIKQPRWTCFDGAIARRGGWAVLRSGGGGCPELPAAILVRADAARGWIERRRWWSGRRACRARPRGMEPAVRRALLCPATRPRAATSSSAARPS